MIRAVADTHTLLWYLHNDPLLSATAGQLIDDAFQAGDEIIISSIYLIEIAYLVEKNRIRQDSFEVVTQELNAPDTAFREVSVDWAVANSLRQVSRAQIPEMPDRIIAATALMLGVPVISRDHKIQASSIPTIW